MRFGNEIHHHCRKVLYDIVSYSTSLTQYPAVCLVIQIIIDLQLGNVTYDAQPPLRIFFSRIRRCYRQQIQSSRGCMQHSLCILRSFFGRILARHKSDHRMRTSSVPTTSKRLCKCDIISFVFLHSFCLSGISISEGILMGILFVFCFVGVISHHGVETRHTSKACTTISTRRFHTTHTTHVCIVHLYHTTATQ